MQLALSRHHTLAYHAQMPHESRLQQSLRQLLASQRTAALAVQASQDRADAQHREDRNAIDQLLAREADLLAAADDDRADLARRLREQYAAGRAAGRADRDRLPAAGLEFFTLPQLTTPFRVGGAGLLAQPTQVLVHR